MAKYLCIIHGRNFLVQYDEEPEKLNFFTARTVTADTQAAAEERAVVKLRSDTSLMDRMLNPAGDPAELRLSECIKLKWWNRSRDGGIAWYHEGDEEGEAGAFDLVLEAMGQKSAA